MHKLASTPITWRCFELDDYEGEALLFDMQIGGILDILEHLRQKYNETKDKRYWKELVRWLPNGWLQTRTVTMNYENLRSICAQRANHKLTEWHSFVKWVRSLPYADQLIFDEELPFNKNFDII